MNAWSTKYLESWAHDFKEEPNNKQTLQFLEEVMSELKKSLPIQGLPTKPQPEHVAPLEDYALRTFNRAFGPGVDLDEEIYHIPAAAVWMDIMGEDICLWSSRNFGDNGRSGFELHKWREWKRGFETCSNSDRLHPQAQGQAERAYSKMKTLETAATCY